MNKIGITGGIGSGKTTIAQFFEILGIPLYVSDVRAKELMVSDMALVEAIKNLIGEEAYQISGNINTSYISEQIFCKSNLLQKMNQLVHPVVEQDFERFCIENKNADYVLEESAVLFETGIYKKMDANILITAPKNDRITRVQNRSKLSREEVEQRVSKQWTDEQKRPLANYIICNDNHQLVIPQILHIHQCIKASI